MQLNSIFEYFDHKNLEKILVKLKNKYEFIEIGTLGNSIFGKSIPRLTLGNGSKNVIYIGGHHGMEWMTSALLMQFVHDFCEEYQKGTNIFDVSTRVLFETRKIHIVPMLNPDGIDYAIHGMNENNIMHNRLLKMNGSADFSHWQANARGVDLNHNYNAGFSEYKIIEGKENITPGVTKYSGEYPESEPETRALCNFVRFERPSLALTLHTQGEEIYYTSSEKSSPLSLSLAKTLSRLTGYKISFPSGTSKYGGFTDWFIEEFDKPSFTLECGRGENPLPFNDFDKIYSAIKRSLFIVPILI